MLRKQMFMLQKNHLAERWRKISKKPNFQKKKLIKNQTENHLLHQSLVHHGGQTHKDFFEQERVYEQNKRKIESSKNKKNGGRNFDD